MSFKTKILTRVYETPDDHADPVEVIATVDHDFCQEKHDDMPGDGVYVSVHGGGRCWLSWEDVPVVIEMLQQALKDKP